VAFITAFLFSHRYQEEVVFVAESLLFFITTTTTAITVTSTITVDSIFLDPFRHSAKRTSVIIIIDSNLSFKALQNLHIRCLPFAYESFLCFLLKVSHHLRTFAFSY